MRSRGKRDTDKYLIDRLINTILIIDVIVNIILRPIFL